MALTDLIFPTRCAGCGEVGPSPCARCIDRLVPLTETEVGGRVDRCFTVLDYDDLARRLVTKLKYGAVRTGIAWFAEAMAARVAAAGEEIDVVTWVPAVAKNRRRRGFDQGEALAVPVARHLGSAAQPLLRRRGRAGQTGRGRAQRLEGPELWMSRPALAPECRVLIVDDVLTTGASVRAAAAALAPAAPRRIIAVVAAHRRIGPVASW